MSVINHCVSGAAAIGLLIASIVSIAAQAQGLELVKQRKEEMGQMGGAFRPLLAVVKGESEDFEAALASAETMNANAKKIIDNFPPGTGRDAFPESRAKPEIWAKRDEFDAAALKLVAESERLIVAAKSKDIEKFRTQFRAYGEACGTCHDGPKKSGGKFRYEAEPE